MHLNVHSEFSIIDSIIKIPTLIKNIKEQGMTSVALTDHNNLFAMIKFYRAALAADIQPIIGAELVLQHGSASYNIILLCKNRAGFVNLSKIISSPHSMETIFAHNSDLIVIASFITCDDLEQDLIKRWADIFHDRFYLELSCIGQIFEPKYWQEIITIAVALDLPVVATNQVRFLYESDFEAHQARVCINKGLTLERYANSTDYTKEQYLKTPDVMAKIFINIPEAIANTLEIAKQCNITIDFDTIYLPECPHPAEFTVTEYLAHKANAGLNKKVSNITAEYTDRLNFELGVIEKMGYVGYFLIVADFIAWAKNNNIPVGPGRGSGAGSLVAYVLDITGIDPLPYGLLFERFLNPERVSMPDFDIDFCIEGRDRVIEYVTNTYGKDAVAQIITYGTMAAKAVIRDVGRVLGHPYGFVDRIAKLIPFELGITLEKALAQEELLQQQYNSEPDVKYLIDLAKKLEGITRNVGKHAAGVVIAPDKLVNFTPLYYGDITDGLLTQFDKDDVESIGLVKFDFLGLRTLTIIDAAVTNINKQHDLKLHIDDLPLDDAATYKMLCESSAVAIFQLESRGIRDLLTRLEPSEFNDLVALVALYRPGPLQSGMVDDYIDRKHGRSAIEYAHPALEPILSPTYGVILYQEQVMQIAQNLAGYTLGAADLLRRAMGKKKPEEMAKQRDIFVTGAIKNSIAKEIATYIFDLMEKFAGYGFNKSHSAAYALITYQTAWLKTHYPAEFMAAVLTALMEHTDKVTIMVADCKTIGITVIAPDINKSVYEFTVANNTIIYGLGALKGVGQAAIVNIAETRTTGKFTDLFDLCTRVDAKKISKRVLEALVKSGSFDTTGNHRAELLASIPLALTVASQASKAKNSAQLDLFANVNVGNNITKQNIVIPKTAIWPELIKLQAEKEALGFYLSGHPVAQYRNELQQLNVASIGNLTLDASSATVAGLIISLRAIVTKRGDKMAFIAIDDATGVQEIAVFSDLYQEQRELLATDNTIVVAGELSKDEYSGGLRMRATSITSIDALRNKHAKYLKIIFSNKQNANKLISELQKILRDHQGDIMVCIEYNKEQNSALLQLGDAWRVTISDLLLQQLQVLQPENSMPQLIY